MVSKALQENAVIKIQSRLPGIVNGGVYKIINSNVDFIVAFLLDYNKESNVGADVICFLKLDRYGTDWKASLVKNLY